MNNKTKFKPIICLNTGMTGNCIIFFTDRSNKWKRIQYETQLKIDNYYKYQFYYRKLWT